LYGGFTEELVLRNIKVHSDKWSFRHDLKVEF